MILNNKAYNIIKWVVSVVLPATSTFLAALGAIYNWDWAPGAVSALVAFTAFLGSIFMISSKSYQKVETRAAREIVADQIREHEFGVINMEEDEGGKIFTLDIGDRDPEALQRGDVVGFRVN